MNKNHKYGPEPEKLIKCEGFDWCKFTCYGMFKLSRGKKKSKFYIMNNDGTFELDNKTWHDVDTWDYADEPVTKANVEE